MPTIEVGLDRTAVARADVRHPVADRYDLHAEFVAEDAGIGEERLLAAERMDVRAAHPDAMHAYESFAGVG